MSLWHALLLVWLLLCSAVLTVVVLRMTGDAQALHEWGREKGWW